MILIFCVLKLYSRNKIWLIMKIVIALDSYKGSVSSLEAAEALADGITSVCPDVETDKIMLADGGEGSLEAFARAWSAEIFPIPAHDALMNPVRGEFAVTGDTAIVELAQICGLAQLKENKSPLRATTFGFGEVILHAAGGGIKRIVCCIGGSASTDGGMGMFQALGGVILDKAGTPFAAGFGGGSLADIGGIDSTILERNLAGLEFITASDVVSPLYGKAGAAYIFAPQKGADPAMVAELDAGLRRLSKISGDAAQTPGDGAAGGVGFALRRFAGARTCSGAELLLDALEFDRHLENADFVITGEGRSDRQTMQGKLPFKVLQAAQRRNIPVILVSGAIVDRDLLAKHFAEVHAVTPEGTPLAEALKRSAENLFKFGRGWMRQRH